MARDDRMPPYRVRQGYGHAITQTVAARPTCSSIGLTFFHSADTCPHDPDARRTATRRASRGSGGPTNGTWSAAVKSWAALPAIHSTWPPARTLALWFNR